MFSHILKLKKLKVGLKYYDLNSLEGIFCLLQTAFLNIAHFKYAVDLL